MRNEAQTEETKVQKYNCQRRHITSVNTEGAAEWRHDGDQNQKDCGISLVENQRPKP